MTTFSKGFATHSVYYTGSGLYINQITHCEDFIVFYGGWPDEMGRAVQYCVDAHLAARQPKASTN